MQISAFISLQSLLFVREKIVCTTNYNLMTHDQNTNMFRNPMDKGQLLCSSFPVLAVNLRNWTQIESGAKN